MVGHYDGEPNVPNSFAFRYLIVSINRVRLVMRQLINSAPSTTDRNKVTRFARVDPERDIMRQSFAVGNLHERPW